MNCDYAGKCSGCSWIEKDYEEQKELKLQRFKEALASLSISLPAELTFIPFKEGGLRDRVDLAYRKNDTDSRFGLFDMDRTEVLDLKSCPQMSENLEELFLDFRKDLPDVKIASIRLRVSPSEIRGVWLDLPNESVKKLLDEESWLERLSEKVEVIEIGQRRKRLIKKENKWKLGNPLAENWFETYVGVDLKAFPLKLNVGGFSQPGFLANKAMIEQVHSYISPLNIEKALELCAGSGNLSFAIASLGISLVSTELDRAAIENAKQSLKDSGENYSVEFSKLNAHKSSEELVQKISVSDLLIVDPPRSGMRGSLEVFDDLDSASMPDYVLYVSCFLPSLSEDLGKFSSFGYKIQSASILDQFSHSPHAEYILLLSKNR